MCFFSFASHEPPNQISSSSLSICYSLHKWPITVKPSCSHHFDLVSSDSKYPAPGAYGSRIAINQRSLCLCLSLSLSLSLKNDRTLFKSVDLSPSFSRSRNPHLVIGYLYSLTTEGCCSYSKLLCHTGRSLTNNRGSKTFRHSQVDMRSTAGSQCKNRALSLSVSC